eukprot:TRINITY_DN13136_c0_g1_i1.p1 TRINITY_DN13136_c0_g1~~TRINITY_DN13136_c0_g1_i1.p1  ORF type:complete len:125 (-),score=18.17 TRINITY_DN13136_c0_g1_i1:58-432(-)
MSAGVHGKVTKHTGNFMPGCATGTKVPHASIPVVALAPLLNSQTCGTKTLADFKTSPEFVCSTVTDANGVYKLTLSPGEYTVIAMIDGKPYLNSYNDGWIWTTVVVPENSFVEWNIDDTSAAYF